MATESVLQRLRAEFDTPPELMGPVVELLQSGATAQFIARFRRDESGDLGEERIATIEERLHFLQELEARKEAILQQARERGSATDELLATLEGCYDQDLLDDIYQSFRPRRRTPAMQAEEKGLGPLALAVRHRSLGGQPLEDAAQTYVSEANGLPNVETVLEGVLLILAEQYASDPQLRAQVRDELGRGILKASVTAPGAKGAQRYKEFFDLQEPVRRVSAQRMLALRRAEREGILNLQLVLADGRELEIFRQRFAADLAPEDPLARFLDLAFLHAYETWVRPACESDLRRKIKEKADRETVRSFARNLRSRLLAPPLGPKRALAVRASRTVMWLVLLGEDGSVLKHETMPVAQDAEREAAVQALVTLMQTERPAGLALPHGRRQEMTEQLVEQALQRVPPAERPIVVPLDEAASAIYATSQPGRKALPGVEVGVRTAISLARRLQDPMHELVTMDPRGLGLGHTLTEVHQGMLTRQLDSVISSCIAAVGVDLNTATPEQLAHVPGLSKELARKIVEHRQKAGGFRRIEDLRQIDGIDDTVFRNVAGFLRLQGGEEPLDATGVHPEDYPLARRLAEQQGVPVQELFDKDLRQVDIRPLVGEGTGRLRVLDVLHALGTVGQDPRGLLTAAHNEGVGKLDDLKSDMQLRGRITNLTEFGAFIDVGVGQDGLLHISQIPPRRVHNPDEMLRVGEVVQIWVVHVDPKEKRISLSMHRPRHLTEGRTPTLGERLDTGRRGKRPRREEVSPMSRAARAPEGRRGSARRGPRPAREEGKPGGGDERPRVHFGGGQRGGGGGTPRVITVESDKPKQEQVGFKGELRSLAGLRALLGAKGDSGGAAAVDEARPGPGQA